MQVCLKPGLQQPNLSPAVRYIVLETYDQDVRVIDDGGAPALYPMSMFVVVDDSTPETWGTSHDADLVESRAPLAFKAPGFFERLWDREPATVALFLAIAALDAETLRRFNRWLSRGQT